MKQYIKQYHRDRQKPEELRAMVRAEDARAEKALGGPVTRKTRYIKPATEFDIEVIWTRAE